jgi:hypothetical protein
LAARGLIYVVVGIVVVDLASGASAPAQASGEGAIEEVARQPGGPALVAVLVVAMACYTLWRAVEALSGRERPGKARNVWVRLGWLVIAAVYGALCARALVLLASGDQAAAGNQGKARAWAAVVMAWPAGRELLGLAGAAVVVGGGALAVWGLTHNYDDELRLDLLPDRAQVAPKVLGAAGDIARGGLGALVGLYMLDGSLDGSASRVKTTDQALQALAHHDYGAALIYVIAVGLFGFAAYSFSEAWLRDL